MNKIVVITGQTATGKTKLALEMADKLNGELVNCDSRQVYKHLDIITGKDTGKAEFNLVNKLGDFDIGYYQYKRSTFNVKRLTKVWLYDIVDPKIPFSSYDYKVCAEKVINTIVDERKTPIIVGGTYFYLYHLLYRVDSEAIPPDWRLRENLNTKTVEELQQILAKINNKTYSMMNQSDRNNPRRLMRKIEIETHKSNRKLHNDNTQNKFTKNKFLENFDINFIGIRYSKKEGLLKAITQRVEERLKNGAIEEVEKLIKMNYTEKDPGLNTIGYKQIIAFLKGEITKEQAISEWVTKEMQYAKRQYTFMKKDPNIRWKEI